MVEISVNFPPGGNPVTTGDREAVVGNRHFCWQITSQNPAVKKVRIVFNDPGAQFFGGSNSVPLRDISSGSTLVWGFAPWSAGDPDVSESKYTVQGFDADGTTLI